MAQLHTTFERSRLYEEVWAMPMMKVAESYDLSSNDIKRAAQAMGVPLPQAGYWAKLAHGKAGVRPSINEKLPATYRHSVWINEDAEEVERRLAAILPTLPALKVERSAVVKSLDACDPLIQKMAARLENGYLDTRGWPRVSNAGCFEIAVSPQNQLRALLAMEVALRNCRSCGMVLVSNQSKRPPAYFEVEGIQLTMRVFESGKQHERELTDKEKKEIKENPSRSIWIPNRNQFTPTNILRLEVMRVDSSRPELSIQESDEEPLVKRLGDLPSLMRTEALRARIWKDIRSESAEREYQRQQRLRERQSAAKDQLATLAKFEKMADEYERARRLRNFAVVLEKTGSIDVAAAPESLAWLRNAADWLDPTIQRHWHEVDDVDIDDEI